MKRILARPLQLSVLIGWALGGVKPETLAQVPQDNWYVVTNWNKSGSGLTATNGGLSSPYGVAIGPDRRIYVGDQGYGRVQVYLRDGSYSFSITNGFGGGKSFSTPRGMITDRDGNLYVADPGRSSVFVFDGNGNYVRTIGGASGSGDGQLSGPIDVAIGKNNEVFVLETGNYRVSAFGSDGTFRRKWGTYGTTLVGQMHGPLSIAASQDGRVYVCQRGWADPYLPCEMKEFDSDGMWKRTSSTLGTRGVQGKSHFIWSGGSSVRLDPSGQPNVVLSYIALYSNGEPWVDISPYFWVFNRDGSRIMELAGVGTANTHADAVHPCHAVGPDGTIVYVSKTDRFLRLYMFSLREQQMKPQNAIPIPMILQKHQRSASPLVDIEYQVTDADNDRISVGTLIFTNSSATPSLAACIRNPTFVEGTSSNLGPNIAANQIHRLTWNAGADWSVNLGDYRVAILAQDSRTNLLDIHYLSLPADNGMPELKISRSPVGTADFMQVWWWLLATGDPGIALASNQIFGVSGTYAAQQLCNNGTTTPLGRTYVFEKMHVREATAQEVQWAKQGNMPSGSSPNQWSPGLSVAGRPSAVNEWGFDTGSWDTNAWKWVVPLP